MAALQFIATNGKLLFTFDWTLEIPSTSPETTISSVEYVLPSNTSPPELVTFTTSEDFANYLSTVGLEGAVHGKTYYVAALATLSNGEVVAQGVTLKCLNVGAD
jgi:hypothetical protein